MGAHGTVRPSSDDFPPEIKISKPDVWKCEYHALKVLAIKDSLFGQGSLLLFAADRDNDSSLN
jgi:hypothetical protein